MANTNFILLSEVRSGTTFFQKLLSSHPSIFCDDEIFCISSIKRLDPSNNQYAKKPLISRDRDPLAFFNLFFNSEFSKQFEAIGFNFMYNQSPLILQKIILDKNIKIIHLKRENSLAAFSSWVQGAQSQFWHNFDNKKVEMPKIEFKFDWFIFNMNIRENFAFLIDLILKDRGNYLTVTYKELIKNIDKVKEDTAKFLGVENKFKDPHIYKTGSDNILERFQNPEAVKEYFSAIGKQYLLGNELGDKHNNE